MALLKHFQGSLAQVVVPTYKLTYFNARGRAETTRYMLKLADVEFIDNRIDRSWSEDRKSKKPQTLPPPPCEKGILSIRVYFLDMLFQCVPELQIGKLRICQSKAVERLVAKQFGEL